MDIVVGTSGHIDHGKTALVKALTGVDADRLPEEKQRGITIDLGFAECTIGDFRIGFVDVPGHERFVKNMLAGVSGIDLVLLVVAADEGVMPQTREHFDICRLLGVDAGLVVLTKSDLVDEEMLELARLDVAELVAGSFLAEAPVVAVSSRTGEGMDLLKNSLAAAAGAVGKRDTTLVVRLPIDRSFTVKGFGTVVTGTLVSGEIRVGDELEIFPTGQKTRIRGLQTHGKEVASVRAGQRTAANLAGVDKGAVERGMMLCESGVLLPTQIVDAEVEVLPGASRGLRSRQRVRVHMGTAEALARVSVLNDTGEIAAGATDLAQLRFEFPVIALPGERFIIRSYSPQATIAGGAIVDNLAGKHRKRDLENTRGRLSTLLAARGDQAAAVAAYVETAGGAEMSFAGLQARTGLRAAILRDAIGKCAADGRIVAAGEYFISARAFQDLCAKAAAAIAEFHRRQPLARGMPVDVLRDRIFAFVSPPVAQLVFAGLASAGDMVFENEAFRLASHRAELSADESTAATRLRSIYANAGFEVPRLEDALEASGAGLNLSRPEIRTVFQLLLDGSEIVKVTDEFYFAKTAIESLKHRLDEYAAGTSERLIDVAKFKEIAGISRKYAIPLLEYFDRTRVTRRAGDKRVIL
jgi:selenocysteine-specific elongation factor